MPDNGLASSNASAHHCIDFSNLDMEKGGAETGVQTVVALVISNGVVSGNQFGEGNESLVANGVGAVDGSLSSKGDFYNSVVEKGGRGGGQGQSSRGESAEKGVQTLVSVVISNGNGVPSNEFGNTAEPRSSVISNGESFNCEPVSVVLEQNQNPFKVPGTKKGSLSRSDSLDDQCRVCQQSSEEALIDLGCQCRGGLSKAHRSCIDTWFRTRGSNKCEICQQVASNVSPPESQPSRNYWVWRIDPPFRGHGYVPERERACYSPLWVALSILIGGLLLDVLISISLGVSALPVNIIIGVLVVLGLGTALRLALECCHEMSLRRTVQRADTNITLGPLGYHPAV